mgnify:CR=1 FL=1
MAIGRLDEVSEGLLLLTTDGKVSAHVTSKKVEKEYYTQVDGEVTPAMMAQLQAGIDISTRGSIYRTLPCAVRLLDPAPTFPARTKRIRDDRHGPTCWLSLTLQEGKYRQVRKMTAAAGVPTLRLYRVRIGNIRLGNLEAGESIEVDSLLDIL